MDESLGAMFKQNKGLGMLCLGLLVFLSGALLVWKYQNNPLMARLLGKNVHMVPKSSAKLISQATYTCKEGKTIGASFFEPDSGEVDSKGSVILSLQDGRSLTLLHAQSGSGARYANSDESFVFWNKGNTAFIQEGIPAVETYSGCVAASHVAGSENWQVFSPTNQAWSVRYPPQYQLKKDYIFESLQGASSSVPGVKFAIPASLYQGTNMSGFDTGVSVEQWTGSSTCLATIFLSDQVAEKTITDMNVEYSVATFSDAGAGNFYEQKVYAIKNSNPCTAVRYFIHSTNIGNYSKGAVQAFNKEALLAQFDTIRESLILAQ